MTSLPGTLLPSDPWRLGRELEASIDPARRRATGAWYTPVEVASLVAGWALDACPVQAPVVCDPACGGGAFLLAAAEHLAARGADRAGVVRRMVAIDVEPSAVEVTERALRAWCDGRASPVTMVGDALVDAWPVAPDVVVGNPPFLSQLGTATARSRARAELVVGRLGAAATGYVDDAALFLLAASRAVGPEGVVALLQPEAVLASASAAGVRTEVAAMVDRVWLPERKLFGANVRVCAVVLRRDRPGPAMVDGGAWAPLVAAARGVPRVSIGGEPLGSVAVVTAGFRDEYYGLLPLLREAHDGDAPVLTSGLVDPARSLWGERDARLGKRPWRAPAAPVDLLPRWALALRRPKIVVATQTRAIEAAADPAGEWVPSTPLISVLPPPDRLWHVLAALLSPAASAWALARVAGAALAADAIKLSASQLRALPLPSVGADWDTAARLVRDATAATDDGARRAGLLAAGAATCRAYAVEPEPLVAWWAPRLPTR